MNLKDILQENVAQEEVGMIPDMKEAGMPASGMERIASVVAAMASKLLELLVPLYGSDSEQGKRILRAIRTLNPLTKGVKADDIAAVLKVIENVIAPAANLPAEQVNYLKQLAMGSPTVSETTSAVPPTPVTTEGTEREITGLESILKT